MFDKKIKKIAIRIIAGFVLMFLLRLAYLLFISNVTYSESNLMNEASNLRYSGASEMKFASVNNYATFDYSLIPNSQALIQQKYEKVATLSTKSNEFEKEQKEIDKVIKQNKALVQFNQLSGLKGNRLLEMTLGVPPENFDMSVEMLQKIGKTLSFNISKSDKTNDFKDIQVKLKLLQDTKKEFVALKSKARNVSESIDVQNKISQIDTQIQQLGLNLNEYSSNVSLCTVKFSLQENEKIVVQRSISATELFAKIFDSLQWAALYYAFILFILLAAFLLALISLKIIERYMTVKVKFNEKSDE